MLELEGEVKSPKGLELDAVTNDTSGLVVWKLVLGRDVCVNVYWQEGESIGWPGNNSPFPGPSGITPPHWIKCGGDVFRGPTS